MGPRLPLGPVMTSGDLVAILGTLSAFLVVLSIAYEVKVGRSRKRQGEEIGRAFDKAKKKDDGAP